MFCGCIHPSSLRGLLRRFRLLLAGDHGDLGLVPGTWLTMSHGQRKGDVLGGIFFWGGRGGMLLVTCFLFLVEDEGLFS